MIVRIATMLVRICGLLALILGILFWTTNSVDGLILLHMLLGILLVLSLWTAGIVQATAQGGSWGLTASAIVVGVLLAVIGFTQTSVLLGSAHWVIQVIHLLLAITAIGLGEMISVRYRKRSTGVVAG